MAEFCTSCPMRGYCDGEIQELLFGPVEYERRLYMGYGPVFDSYAGRIGALMDENKRVSAPIKLPDNKEGLFEKAAARLDDCKGPTIETRGVFRKRDYAVNCPALGRFAISRDIAWKIQDQIQNEANLLMF